MLKTAEIDRYNLYACPRRADAGGKLALLATIALHALVVGALAAVTIQLLPAEREGEIEASFAPAPSYELDSSIIEAIARRPPQLLPEATAFQILELPGDPSPLDITEIEAVPIETEHQPEFEPLLFPPTEKTAPAKKEVASSQSPPQGKPPKQKPSFVQAKVRRTTRPQYPESARRRGQQGTAHVQLTVNTKGEVTGASVVRSTGHPALDASALKAASRWKFTAATMGNRPTSTRVVVPIRFNLN